MEYRCEACKRNFETKDSLDQHNLAKHNMNSEKKEKAKINFKKYFIIIAVIIIIILIVLSILNYTKKPGKYDEFAKCLTEKGVVIYGNDFCQYTAKQLNFFGKSEKYLNYVKCSENQELCDQKGVSITPTWEINGEMYTQVQTFERLAELSGCEI